MSHLWGDKRSRFLGTSSVIPIGNARDRAAKGSTRVNSSQSELLCPNVPGVYIRFLTKVHMPTYWNTKTPNIGGAYAIEVDLDKLTEGQKIPYERLAQKYLGEKEEWLAPFQEAKKPQKTKKRK